MWFSVTGNRGRLSQETSAIKEKQKGLSSLRCRIPKHYLSFMSSGAAVEVELPDRLLFTDTAYRQRYIDPNTVITDEPWHVEVTAGSYHSPSASESVYVYEEAGVVKLCFLTSGAVFTVMAMPDRNSIDSDTTQRTDRRDSCGSR